MFPYINRLHDILKDQNPFPLIRMPLASHLHVHRVPTPITRRQAAPGATVFQNVQNTVEYPPMTPSNIAPGLREQVLYLGKLLFRKLHADLLSNDPDQNHTTR